MKATMVLLTMFLAACSSMTTNDIQPGDADRAIAKQNQNFMAAAQARDVDRLMKFYSDSAVVLPPNAPAIIGRDAIRQFWSGHLGASSFDAKLMTDDVTQSCDMAAERGRYELTITPQAGGASIHDSGKYVVVWRKLNGEWRAAEDIFNSSVAH